MWVNVPSYLTIKLEKLMRLKKTFVFFFFFAYIGAWLKSAEFKLDLVTSQDCMEYGEGHFFQITAVVLQVSFNWEEL